MELQPGTMNKMNWTPEKAAQTINDVIDRGFTGLNGGSLLGVVNGFVAANGVTGAEAEQMKYDILCEVRK